MPKTTADPLRLSEDYRDKLTELPVSQSFLNKKIGNEWLDLDKHVAWNYKMVVSQVACRLTHNGWLLMIKAHRNGKSRVAFVAADTFAEAYELGGEFAYRGCLTWQDDKWPPEQRQPPEP